MLTDTLGNILPIKLAFYCLRNPLRPRKNCRHFPHNIQASIGSDNGLEPNNMNIGTDDGRVNTLRPRQNGRHFPDDIFKCNFLNENGWVLIPIPLKFVPNGQINNIPTLVQIMAWRRSGDKPLSEPMMVSLLTHIRVTRPQWVNWHQYVLLGFNGLSICLCN